MTYGRVPNKFINLEGNDIKISRVPTATDWRSMAQDCHYLMGLGTQLIPFAYCSGTQMKFSGNLQTEFAIHPKTQGLDRIWVFKFRTTGAAGTFTFKIGDEPASSSFAAASESYIYLQERNFTPNNETIFVPFSATCSTSGVISSYGCFELPRMMMQSGSDLGIDDLSLGVRQQIHGSGTRESVKAVAYAVSASFNVARTAGIFDWHSPLKTGTTLQYFESPFSGSTLGTQVHFASFSASIRMRKKWINELTGAAEYSLLIRGTDAATQAGISLQTGAGTVSFTASVGDGYRWFTGTLPVLVDGDTGNALPVGRSTADFLGIKLNPLGAGKAYIHAIHIGEKDKGITPPAYTPATIWGSSLMSWHRSDTNVTSGTFGPDYWGDASGNGRHFVQPVSGNQAAFSSSNGQAAFKFTSANTTRLDLTSSATYGSPGAVHVIRVVRATDPAASNPSSGLDEWGTSGAQTHFPFTDGNIYDATAGIIRATVGNPTPSLDTLNVYSSISTGGGFSASLNGTVIYSGSTLGVAIRTTPRIGGASTGQYFNGILSEVIVISGTVTNEQYSQFATYISSRYGISLAATGAV